jgi:hypothetical protein
MWSVHSGVIRQAINCRLCCWVTKIQVRESSISHAAHVQYSSTRCDVTHYGCAGKISLNPHWIHGGYFHDIDQPTVVASYSFKKIRYVRPARMLTRMVHLLFTLGDCSVKNGRTVRLQLWDTGGAEEHSSLTTRFLRSSQAGVVVFDMSNRESFLHCNHWIKGFKVSAWVLVVMFSHAA